MLQIITIEDARAERYQNDVDFIQMFIFPVVSYPKQQLQELAQEHGFTVITSCPSAKITRAL